MTTDRHATMSGFSPRKLVIWFASSKAFGAIVVLGTLLPLFSFTAGNFLTVGNLINIGLQSSILLLIALPMTFVILSEGLDLSPGALLSLCGVVLAMVLVAGHSLIVATLAAIIVGIAFGALNGVLVSYLAMPPFVVTLGTAGIAYGLALVLTGGNAVSGLGEAIVAFNNATFAGIPVLILIAVAAYAFFHLLLYQTRFGRYVIGIGGNLQALKYAGVKANLFHACIYALSGAAAGLAALCMIGRTNAGHPGIALGMEFDAIAAVVLGGTSFERGEGWLFGTVLGVLAIGVLRNGLNLLAIDTSLHVIAIGLLVIVILLIGRFNRHAGPNAHAA